MKGTFYNWIIACLIAIPMWCGAQVKPNDDPARNLQKFSQFYRYLNGMYIDTVHNAALIESAIRSVLSQLDPHSTYITAEEMVSVKEAFGGSFSGIGIEFNILNDTIIVVNVISGGPSEKVGLQPNDKIIAVDGKPSIGVKQTDVPKLLRGPKGTQVSLTVARHGEQEPLEFLIVRDNIPINTVDAAYMVNPTTGYVRVNRFADNTYRELFEAVEKMDKPEALILDLRNNGGGTMDAAIAMSNFFLPQGSLIISTEGMKVPTSRYAAKVDGVFTKGKVIVLINESSASSSEIVAGAIQDWDRGLLIGRRSFGKGLVQTQFPFSDGSAVRLTVSRYHTPSGRAIQRPYENGRSDLYYEDFNKRFTAPNDSLPTDSTQIYRTLRSGRTVYGGGGITPDIVVPVDTTSYTKYWGDLIRKGVIEDFIIDYLDKNRADITTRYPDPDRYIEEFSVTDEMLDKLVAAADTAGIAPDPQALETSRLLICTQLKASIAQKIWTVNEFYRVVNKENDPVFAKALEVLDHWDEYSKGLISE